LPRGNQQDASAVVVRRGHTVRQTDLLVEEVLARPDPAVRAALLARRLSGPETGSKPGPGPTRAVRNEADWMSGDLAKLRELAARLEARLLATPLETLPSGAAEILRDALAALLPVLRALSGAIRAATGCEDAA
jgi:hypothetical protein